MFRWVLLGTTSLTAWIGSVLPALADPISIAILGAVGIQAAAGSVAVAATTFALTTAVSGALTYASTLLTQKSSATTGGFQTDVQYGGTVSRQIPFGVVRTPGQFIYFAGVGEKNKTLHLVYALADWECDGLDHVYVDDVKKTLSPVSIVGTEHARYQVSGFGANLIVKFFRGTMTQTADTELISASAVRSTGLGNWTSDHKGHGMCYVSLVLIYDENIFQGGIPTIEYQLRGAKLYDRRFDSTAGGSGTQRYNDPTTWVFSKNPIVMEETYRRGFYRNGVRILGMGMPASVLLADHYVSAANVCDEVVNEGGDDRARYECSTIINDDAEYRVAVDTFMGACGGVMVEKSGLFGPFAGAAQSIVATFDRNDLILGHPTSTQTKQPRSGLFNAIYGTYTNAESNWEDDSIPPVINGTWETEDNGERLIKEISLPQVTNGYQASRLAKIIAELGRRQVRHTGVYGPKYAAVEVGDWVEVTTQFDTYEMLVVSKSEAGFLQWQFSFQETNTAIYDSVASTPSTPPIVQEDIPDHVTTITGFSVIAVSVAGANNQIRPGIEVHWTPPTDPSVVAVKIEYRVKFTTAVQSILHPSPLDGVMTIQSDLMASTDYEVRARYMLNPDLTTDWSAWLTVTTTSHYTVVTSRIALDTQQYFDRLQQEVEGEGLSVLLEAMKRYDEDQITRYTMNQRITEVSAAQDGTFALVRQTMTALASENAAFAELLLQVSAQAAGATANGAFKMEAVAAEGGATASIAAFVSADNGASYKRAGWRLDVFDEGGGNLAGRIVFEVDYMAIVQNAAGVPFSPFSIIGPDVYLNRMVVGDEIISQNYDEDGDGNPAVGFRAGSDGLLRAYDARFTDFQVRGGIISERPLILAQPNFRNGVPEGLPFGRWISPGDIVWNPALAWTTMQAFRFHRTPDTLYAYFLMNPDGSTTLTAEGEYFVPPGNLLPPVIVADLAGSLNTVEWRDDGSIVRVQYTGNGGINTTNTARGKWMYDAEIDPLNLRALNKIISGLGFSRHPQPIKIPEFLADGITPVTAISFKMWGAGGALDETAGRGGPGGYVAATFVVGAKDSAELIKRGDILWLIPGEGGRSKTSDVILGFGGRGQSQERRSSGGGGTFVFLHEISIANLLMCAGGGGAGEGGQAGGPGGAAASGGNGVSGDDHEIMTGLSWTFDGVNSKGGGGGGRIGGGWLTAVSNRAGGKGGTNFIRTGATATTNSSSAVSANGNATTHIPPNTGDADWVANQYVLGNSAAVGMGKTLTTIEQCGGNGLIVITYS